MVVRLPVSSIDRLVVPPDWICNAVFVAALVSLIMNAGAVPALVRVNEVEVAKLLPKVKAIFRALVVVMVLPESYACCKVTPDAFGAQTEN